MPPPGAPEFSWMSAPAILPCRASSGVSAGTRLISVASTVDTSLAADWRLTTVAWPVTMLSSRRSTSRARAMSPVVWPASIAWSAAL